MDFPNERNISPNEILAQKAQLEAEKPIVSATKFDVKNYLNARLGSNETRKTITIRLLPFSPEGGSPFYRVHMHTVRVNKEVSNSGWKTFPCPNANHVDGINQEKGCPFCELAEESRIKKISAQDEAVKKNYGDIEFENKVKDMWIVRCIERGHEEDGVKFWLFNSSKRGDGVYDKMFNIFQQRYTKAMEQGKINNIFDLREGKDLLITLTKDTNGKTVYNVTDDDEKTPLSTDEKQMEAWVNDPKKWNEVYTFKNYDYMQIVAMKGVPMYDATKKTYVDKLEKEKEARKEIEENITRPTVDLSLGVPQQQSVFENSVVEESLPF